MRAKKSVMRELRRTSIAELAVLEMTNDKKDAAKSGSIMVTSKEAYVWATLMAHIAEKRPDITPEQLLLAATSDPKIRRDLKFYYNKFPMAWGEDDTAAVVPPDVIGAAIRSLRLDVKYRELSEGASIAYSRLVKRGWIEDPVEIFLAGAALVSVMGIVPVGFTQKTKEGRSISKKMKALYWSYEKSISRGITTTKVEFRLLKMIKAFKAGIGAFKVAIQDDDDV
jgi:hypothetical protein